MVYIYLVGGDEEKQNKNNNNKKEKAVAEKIYIYIRNYVQRHNPNYFYIY